MNKKLLAGLGIAAVLAGGGGAAALAAASPPAAAASTAAAAPSASWLPAYGPLGSLAAKGTISQAQATAIHDALISYLREHWQDMRKDCNGTGPGRTPWMLERGGALETVLGQLARKGVITQSQASAVTSAFRQWLTSHHGFGQRGDGRGMMGGPGMMGRAGYGMMNG